MNGQGLAYLCGFACIYPLIFFFIPGLLLGKYWGRIHVRSPLHIRPPDVQERAVRRSGESGMKYNVNNQGK